VQRFSTSTASSARGSVPGLIATERAKDNPARSVEQRLMPLGRRGKVEEVSALVRYLCGPQARYVTGQSWHVNGGAWMG